MKKTLVLNLPCSADVRGIRMRMGATVKAFAALMAVPEGIVKLWEKGEIEPEGATRVALLLAEYNPVHFLNALREAGFK